MSPADVTKPACTRWRRDPAGVRGRIWGAFVLGPAVFSVGAAATGAAPAYVGDAACVSCHQAIADTYRSTAHAHTSSFGTGESIKGRFGPGFNILRTVNPNLFFTMDATDRGCFQRGVLRKSPAEILERAERIDVVVGSGRKGQTYLFWDGNDLFQLPVSYWTELGDWVNSPGYIDGTADFDRPIAPRCLECHASSFTSRAPPLSRYDKASLVLGIACEKCHGAGAAHVARYRADPLPPPATPSAIVNPAKLPRDRQVDVCSLCHAGAGEPLTPALSFAPGDVLASHLVFAELAPGAHLDVHASQVQLMARSRCFRSTPTMTCTTCHQVHRPQRDLADFAARCLACHRVENCKKFPALGHAIDRRCVECHMPLQETDQIVSSVNGRSVQPKVRNHQIAIYPDVRLP